jgi:hypothetical protein
MSVQAAKRRAAIVIASTTLLALRGAAGCTSFSSTDDVGAGDASAEAKAPTDTGANGVLINDTFDSQARLCGDWAAHSNMSLDWSVRSHSAVGSSGSCKLCLTSSGLGKATRTIKAPLNGTYSVTAWLAAEPLLSSEARGDVGFQSFASDGGQITAAAQNLPINVATWTPFTQAIEPTGAATVDVTITLIGNKAGDCMVFDDVTVEVK